MIKKRDLNNKGMTLIEIIVCFVIVVVIVLSMFKVVNNYKDKQDIESYKNAIITYKNTITKTIWEDIIKNGGIVKCNNVTSNVNGSQGITFSYELHFLNGNVSKLSVLHNVQTTDDDADRIDEDESNFYIQYGPNGNEERFDFPKMYNVQFNHPEVNTVKYSGTVSNTKGELFHLHVGVYNPDLQIGDKYNVLDIYTPNVSDYYYALGN